MESHFKTQPITSTHYEVISKDFATESFKSIDKAIERANDVNRYRIDTTNSTKDKLFLWRGHDAEIVEVTRTVRKLHVFNLKNKTI